MIARRLEDDFHVVTMDLRNHGHSPSAAEMSYAQMAAFCDFYRPSSAFARLKLLPVKKYSWLANMAIYWGLYYYYRRHKKGRRLPSFRVDG